VARYTGPVCRQCRREGEKLFLKGDKCYSEKCPVEKRGFPPGQHGRNQRRGQSEYGLQLREKQKVKRMYGVMEKQFHRYYREAASGKGVTGELLLQILERRLDNVVYRMGFGASRPEARQMVNHGHFLVNGRKTDIPSYSVREGDEIEIKSGSRDIPRILEMAERASTQTTPEWLEVDWERRKGKVLRLPEREDLDMPIEEHLIVEMYSR